MTTGRLEWNDIQREIDILNNELKQLETDKPQYGNRLYLYNLGIKTFGGFATLGGVIQALQLFTQPDLDIKSILLSFPAWVVYVFVCLTIIFAMLRERYKSMSQRVEVLNVKLNEQDAMIRSLQEMMKIVPFKGRFFLTTEYLYNELGEYIQNNIDIDSIEIKNTIEKEVWETREIPLSD